jgi:hypothetical protein
MLQIIILIICDSGGEKSAPALSRKKIPLKIEGDHGKSQRPPLSYSDPRSDELTFGGNDRKFHSKVFFFFSSSPLRSKVFNLLITTRLSDVFRLDSHERIEDS